MARIQPGGATTAAGLGAVRSLAEVVARGPDVGSPLVVGGVHQ